jgi:hypothetical protein
VTHNQIENCTLLDYYAVNSGECSSQLLCSGRLKSHVAIKFVTGVQFPEKAEKFSYAATSLVAWNAATLSSAYIAALYSFRDKAAR